MKLTLLNLAVLFLVVNNSFAQALGVTSNTGSQKTDTCHAGVYITQDDFLKNRLSHKVKKSAKGYSFGFPPPADWKLEIKIEKPDTVLRFKQGSVYGYSECGKKYRYSPGGELYAPEDFYRLEESKGLIIYSSAFTGGDELFYSLDLTSKIHRLKLSNLEKDFKNNPDFIEAVKRLNKEREIGDLGKKDEQGNFIINKLFDETVKK